MSDRIFCFALFKYPPPHGGETAVASPELPCSTATLSFSPFLINLWYCTISGKKNPQAKFRFYEASNLLFRLKTFFSVFMGFAAFSYTKRETEKMGISKSMFQRNRERIFY